ncbi:TonB-linked SusC/RagA family outer membrane protein [Dysgonomonas alginatilytica]|uniref:TonB-linked SusC/RagA family outer membrane protein n=1 Tax=Dysgonomonas alginatilytica TaxID=1605892 RepID=A0A2V3PRL5_9BACT|nr:TonB-dependent receptor [Dysgonomonas alginatilytica]PXV65025.1 TonB-linked SusC/RagA family outer membrane protein [Dysgonomonas alginatilytica]
MKKCRVLIMCIFLLICGYVHSQTIKVDGKVTDATTGEAIIGTTIVDTKDKTKGTITDLDGNFSLMVDKNSTLIITLLGYQSQNIPVQGRSFIDVKMTENSIDLESVVVVGVSMKKSDLTGAVGRISSDKLEELPVLSVNEALQGRVAGVYISKDPNPGGASTQIKIRGNNSIQFGTDPIYVIDGVVLDGGFNLVNPEDIASIDILKDASATSLYGSRGANGVVVITTKRGKKGGQITYDGWVGFSDYTKKMPLMGTNDIYNLRVDAAANTYMDKNPTANRQNYISQITSPENFDVFADYEHASYKAGQSYNWLDEVTRKGFQQNHTVSFSDADEKGNYYLSFGYSKQEGLVKNSDFERFNGKVNIERSLKPWVKVGTTTSYIRGSYGLTESSVFWNAMTANPMYPINDTDIYMKWGSAVQTGVYNPILSLTIDGDRMQNRLISANYVNLNPMEGLNIRNTLSIDKMDQQEYWYTPKNVGQSIRNAYDGEASHRKDEWFNWQWDGSASYETTFAKKHKLFAMVAINVSKNQWQFNQVKGRGFASDEFSYYSLKGATKKDVFDLSSDFTNSSIMAFVQRANYSYDNKYFATLTVRQEGSSKISPQNRWGTFPSLALSWNVANEDFVKKLNIFDQLKLRAGYGIVGNQNIPLYAIYSLWLPYVSGGTVLPRSDGKMGNTDLRWEKQKQWNFGLDVSILQNRLSFTADYYNIKNTDLLMQRSLSSMSGYTNTIANVGELQNNGFEFSVNGAIVDTKDFKWNVSGNISFNKNKIKKLYGDVDVIWNKGGYTGVEIQREGNIFLGESLNSIYTYKFDRLATQADVERINNGKLDVGGRTVQVGDILPKDLNGDDVIDDLDRTIVGKTDPKFFGGFSTDFNYKGIGLSAIFNYSSGGKKLSGLYETMMSGSGMTASHEDLKNRWTPENTNTNIPRAYRDGGRFTYGDVDLGVQNSSFLRMAAITLSYNLPKSVLENIKLNNALLYFTGNNLLTVTDFKGYDPETGDSYPATKMYVVGVRFGF